jgi:hypothetical protein
MIYSTQSSLIKSITWKDSIAMHLRLEPLVDISLRHENIRLSAYFTALIQRGGEVIILSLICTIFARLCGEVPSQSPSRKYYDYRR